ncbi:hypothetical protein MY3296_000931 [Beauveria thailandica]
MTRSYHFLVLTIGSAFTPALARASLITGISCVSSDASQTAHSASSSSIHKDVDPVSALIRSCNSRAGGRFDISQ